MIVHNGNILVNNGRWINCSQPYSVKFHVNILPSLCGTITAEPVEGYDGTVVKLSHTDNQYYTFMNYNVSGARLYNDRYFRFEGSDVTVSGTWQFSTEWLCDHWVKIGNQIWTNKNLEYDDGEGGIYTAILSDVNGYNLGVQYYYTWNAAMRVASKLEGWHLPSNAEAHIMWNYVAGTSSDTSVPAAGKLKATYSYSIINNINGAGTDDYGFTLLPTGRYRSGSLTAVGNSARHWLSDVNHSVTDNGMYSHTQGVSQSSQGYSYDNYIASNYESTGFCYQIRLLKDNSTPPVCV